MAGEPATVKTLDLIADDKPVEEVVAAGSPPPESKPYDPSPVRESVRGQIAQSLVGILAILILFSFLTLWFCPGCNAGLKDLMTLLFGPVAALVGSAIGFYFGGANNTLVKKE